MWVAERAVQHAQRDGATEMDQLVATCLKSYSLSLELMDSADLIMTDLEAERFFDLTLMHLQTFALLNKRSQLQAHLGGSVLILPMAFFSLWALFRVTDMVREWVSLADDGVKDKMEEAWDEATEETEDDVMALTLSFLVVQTFRFWIYGVLPDEEGNLDNRQIDPSLVQAFVSLGVGMLIALLSYLRTIYGSSKHSRYSVWLRLISDFSSCWMVMFSIDRIMTITSLGGAEYGVLGNVPRQRLNFTWDVFG
ncbi:unnamed protein product [Cladocopium goreaui]|uniref:Sodium channel protein type 4 subunit alpha A n=1 Tax=Cladocopium goreaui TaxID=2562237 RepID=A0A9P1DSP3_9DINO|nr:unnamed protein product [Cladocopium goreaui]